MLTRSCPWHFCYSVIRMWSFLILVANEAKKYNLYLEHSNKECSLPSSYHRNGLANYFYKGPDRNILFCGPHTYLFIPNLFSFLPLSSNLPFSFSFLFFQLFKNIKPILAHGLLQTGFSLHLAHGLQFANLCYSRRGDWGITSNLCICGLLVRLAHCCNRWLQNFVDLIQSQFISRSHHSPVWTGGERVCGGTSLYWH